MSNKHKIALYLTSIFVAGGIAGGSIAWTASTSKKAARPDREFPDTKRMCDFMRKRLQEKVGLTPEQVARIEPVIERGARDIKAIHEKTLQDVERVINRTHEEIAATLTDEQKARLEEVERERREFWRKHLARKEQKEKEHNGGRKGEREKGWDKEWEKRREEKRPAEPLE